MATFCFIKAELILIYFCCNKVFAVNFDLFFSVINLNNSYNKNFVLKYTILYIYCVDILMWSPTKLDFPFLCFFCDLL
jgi:hypothetical protein